MYVKFYTFSGICSGVYIDGITGWAVAKATGRGHVETDKQFLNEAVDDVARGTGQVVKVRSFVVKVGCFIVLYNSDKNWPFI